MFTALEDIKLETIDFNWIKQTTKVSHLKRAIRLIEMDGDFYKQLKDACYERIGEIDPSQKRRVFNNSMQPEMQEEIARELQQWTNFLETNQENKKNSKQQMFDQEKQLDPEEYFEKNEKQINKAKRAENERIKGNEAIRSKDYTESLRYYNYSLELDPSVYQTYGNRALAYIKMKEFQKALNDCDSALRLNPKYTKAYHRKAKALLGIKNKVQAYKTLQQALKVEPQNTQINQELKQLREQMSEEEIKRMQGNKGGNFKKIVIEEDSDDQEEMEEKK